MLMHFKTRFVGFGKQSIPILITPNTSRQLIFEKNRSKRISSR